MDDNAIDEAVAAHEGRNASLRRLFLEKQIALDLPSKIDLHFWVWGPANASAVAESLRTLNLEVPMLRPAGIQNDPERWNIEASVRQSIDLTMRREFITDLVRLAHAHGGVFDGWGTSV
jgi:hypothetical protein